MTVPLASMDEDNLNLLNIASRNVKWYSYSGKQFGSLLKMKHTLII